MAAKKKSGRKKKAWEPSGPMELHHSGSLQSFQASGATDYQSICLTFDDDRQLVIAVDGASPIDMFCPSVEGTVMWVRLRSGEERYYSTETGQRLTEDELWAGRQSIHFYR
jgi:hypothetical protein